MIPWENIEKKFNTWSHYFKPFYDSGGFEEIYKQLKEEGKNIKIVPEGKHLFKAFELCPANELKVIFLGQSPYPTVKYGKVTADGMCFSCSNTNEEQPSLKLIYDAIEDDLFQGLNLTALRNTDLSEWAKQGVLLLNSSLTCQEGNPGSHKDLWNPFMNFFFTEVIENFSGISVVFMGKRAAYYNNFPSSESFHIKVLEHPAAASYSKRPWNHDNVFSWTNNILKGNTKEEINWVECPF